MAGSSIDITELPLPTKKLASQSLVRGVDTVHQEEIVIGDGSIDGRIASVTAASALKVDNSAVVQPVNDNGGAITVDALDLDIRNLIPAQDEVKVSGTAADGVAVSGNPIRIAGKDGGGLTQDVITDATGVLAIQDNAGSLTVDAPVGTPVFARLSDGAAALVGQKTMALSLPVALASDQSTLPTVSEIRAATLHVTATAAVNTASTCTLPAAGAGLFHYITSVELVKLYSVIGVAAGAGVIITTTNLPGNPAWTTEQLASAAGTAPKVVGYVPTTPLKSSVANTATTFVAPVQLQTIWRWNVSYFTAV